MFENFKNWIYAHKTLSAVIMAGIGIATLVATGTISTPIPKPVLGSAKKKTKKVKALKLK